MAQEWAVEGEGMALPAADAHEAPAGANQAALAHGVCANCGTALQGPFCAQCGQHVEDYHRSVWRLVQDGCSSLFNWDNRIIATLVLLLTRPGLLTQEFLAGHRVRYVHPLRLFLFTSAVCLTLMHFGKTTRVRTRHSHAKVTAPLASPSPSPASTDSTVTPSPRTPDHWDVQVGDRFERKIDERIESEHAATPALADAMTAYTQRRFSWVVLALLPIFAWFLQRLYRSNDSYYFAHLIFSLHYHTVLLMFWTFYSWINGWLSGLVLNLVWWVAPALYLFQALRHVYGGSQRRTIFKLVVLECGHAMVLGFGMAFMRVGAVFAS